MGRTYRRQDKKAKKNLREGRRAKQNKRSIGDDERTDQRVSPKKRKDSMLRLAVQRTKGSG